jgi:hypothetical protein
VVAYLFLFDGHFIRHGVLLCFLCSSSTTMTYACIGNLGLPVDLD